MGTTVFRKAQYGAESSHGSAVAADTMLLCTVALPDADREIHVPQIDAGERISRLINAATTRRVLAEGTLEDKGGLYFEMLPLMFAMTLTEGSTTGSGDVTWTFDAPLTGDPDAKSITLEYGDDAKGYEIAYCMGYSLRITGDCDSGEVHGSVNWFGQKVDQTTLTADLSPADVELMNGTLSQVYIDDTWAGAGTTEIEDALVSWEINISGGLHPKHLGGTSLLFSSHGQGDIEGSISLTLERTSAVTTEELNFRPAADYVPDLRVVRLKCTGDQIGEGESQTLQVDMAGVWESWTPLGDEKEGNTLDTATLMLGKDTTSGAKSLSVTVITTVSAI